MSVYSDYTYDEYLRAWERQFGDAETGECGYWRGYTCVPVTVHRLSPDEFKEHASRMVAADEAFNRALKAQDDAGMEAALAAGFPVELALLI